MIRCAYRQCELYTIKKRGGYKSTKMILTGLSLFFVYLFLYDLFWTDKSWRDYDLFDIGYLCTVATIALALGWTPLKYWQFERMLSEHAAKFAERSEVTVKCTSVFDSIFDPYDMTRAGTAYIETGEIIFHHGWCKHFMSYLEDPVQVNDDELFSMQVFTHEVMHVRGERNEQKTDCQAIQRNHQLGIQMGIDEFVARQNAVFYYRYLYKKHPYYDKRCAPNQAFDERLPDSIWSDI